MGGYLRKCARNRFCFSIKKSELAAHFKVLCIDLGLFSLEPSAPIVLLSTF